MTEDPEKQFRLKMGINTHSNENSSIELNWDPVLLKEEIYISGKNVGEDDEDTIRIEKIIRNACRTHGVTEMKCESILNSYENTGTVPQWLANTIKTTLNDTGN